MKYAIMTAIFMFGLVSGSSQPDIQLNTSNTDLDKLNNLPNNQITVVAGNIKKYKDNLKKMQQPSFTAFNIKKYKAPGTDNDVIIAIHIHFQETKVHKIFATYQDKTDAQNEITGDEDINIVEKILNKVTNNIRGDSSLRSELQGAASTYIAARRRPEEARTAGGTQSQRGSPAARTSQVGRQGSTVSIARRGR